MSFDRRGGWYERRRHGCTGAAGIGGKYCLMKDDGDRKTRMRSHHLEFRCRKRLSNFGSPVSGDVFDGGKTA
jgi:hypothetical protein